MHATPTRTNLNDWVRGTRSTYKITTDARVLFIQDDADGYHLFEQRIVGHTPTGEAKTTVSRHLSTHPTAAAARHAGDTR